MKARQAAKMREFRDALVTAGIVTLDAQARTLGLSRSTTWTILRGCHKSSGMSAAIINRMLAEPGLPSPIRDKIVEYVKEKMSGYYGDSQKKRSRFANKLTINCEDMCGQWSGGRNMSRSQKYSVG
jgi:hypothetical protein